MELTEEQQKFLEDLEEEFKDRFTELDDVYWAEHTSPPCAPPIVEPWYFKPRRKFDFARNNRGNFRNGQDWNRDRSRSRDRNRDRSRSRDRNRDRSRSRDRNRDRAGGRDRDQRWDRSHNRGYRDRRDGWGGGHNYQERGDNRDSDRRRSDGHPQRYGNHSSW